MGVTLCQTNEEHM